MDGLSLAEDADQLFLCRTGESGRLYISTFTCMSTSAQDAFDRSLDNGWIRLLDVRANTRHPGALVRVFSLTDAGRKRLESLNQKRAKTRVSV